MNRIYLILALIFSISVYSEERDAFKCQIGDDEDTEFIIKAYEYFPQAGLDVKAAVLHFSLLSYEDNVELRFIEGEDFNSLSSDGYIILAGGPNAVSSRTKLHRAFLALPKDLVAVNFLGVDDNFRAELIYDLYGSNTEYVLMLNCMSLI